VIIREADADDLDAAWRVRRAAFGGSGDRPAAWPGVASEERRFVADDGGRLCGFLRVRRFRQFFGGRVVPMGGVASVAVDPYARGKGVASGLLDASLEAMRADGQAVSALFTTVPALYRGRGWERAGVVERAEVPIDALRGVAAQRGDVSLGPIDNVFLVAPARWPVQLPAGPQLTAPLVAARLVAQLIVTFVPTRSVRYG